MTKGIAKTLISLILLTNSACAEDPKAPVTNPQGVNSGANGVGVESEPGKQEQLELMALSYRGRDPFGKECLLYISAIESHEEDHVEHKLVAKFDYDLHGEVPMDSIVEFKRYNIDTNTYYPIDSVGDQATPSLVSAILKDESIDVDFNKLLEYEQSGELLQTLRADFLDMNFDAFEASLDKVLDDNSLFAINKSDLDQLQSTVLKLSHAGHYDAVACSNFKIQDMKTVEFSLGDESGEGHKHEH